MTKSIKAKAKDKMKSKIKSTSFILSRFQGLPRGEGSADAQVEGLRVRVLHQEGGGRERHRADERPVARIEVDQDELGHQETAHQ